MVRSLDGPSSAKDDNKLGSPVVAIMIIAAEAFTIGTTMSVEVSEGRKEKASSEQPQGCEEPTRR